MLLALSLFVLWVFANNENSLLGANPGRFAFFAANNDFALVADFFSRCLDFHFISFKLFILTKKKFTPMTVFIFL